jgi:hypothetical protein
VRAKHIQPFFGCQMEETVAITCLEGDFSKSCYEGSGGEGGIRTLGTGVSPYNGLANRRIRPLCHLSATI